MRPKFDCLEPRLPLNGDDSWFGEIFPEDNNYEDIDYMVTGPAIVEEYIVDFVETSIDYFLESWYDTISDEDFSIPY